MLRVCFRLGMGYMRILRSPRARIRTDVDFPLYSTIHLSAVALIPFAVRDAFDGGTPANLHALN